MALSNNALAARLRTTQGRTSKAPMQNVQLPTQTPRTSYKTPSGPAASAPQPRKAPGTDPATLAKAGGLLGQMGKNLFNSPESMALDKASSANLGQIGGLMDMFQGSNVDVASNMAANAANNLPQASMLGNGIPLGAARSASLLGGTAATGDWSGTSQLAGNLAAGNLGDLSSVTSAVSNATDAASAATDGAANASSWGIPGGGSLIGAGISASQGNYGKAAGQAIGGAAGSYFGPLGTMAGSTLGGFFGGLFDR